MTDGRRLVIAAIALVSVFARADAAPQAHDDGERARADLGFLVHQITTRHPNPFYVTPKAAFDREVDDLAARIPSLPPHAVVVGFAKIAALIGDGHTRATIPPTGGVLPIEIEWLDGMWRIVRAALSGWPRRGARVDSSPAAARSRCSVVHRKSDADATMSAVRSHRLAPTASGSGIRRAADQDEALEADCRSTFLL